MMATSLAAVSKHKSLYVGGSAVISKAAVGVISTGDKKVLNFSWDGDRGFGDWSVPYDKIRSVSYGQHVGRGVGSSIALGVSTLGVGAVPMLFSKKRQHYLTIEFVDDLDNAQNAVFEVGKDAVRDLLSSLERLTGKKVILEEEAPVERKTASSDSVRR